MRISKALFLCVMLATTLASCASHEKQRELDETLLQYEQMVRWAEWDGAANLIHPEYLAENPITRLEMDRLRLFRTNQYIIRGAAPYDDGNGLRQTVELRMYNKTRGVEKVVMDNQDWQYDEDRKVWLLHSGLPDPTQKY